MENLPQTDFVLLQFIQSEVHQKSYFYWIQDLIAMKRNVRILKHIILENCQSVYSNQWKKSLLEQQNTSYLKKVSIALRWLFFFLNI